METLNKALSELIRKEQGWNVETQSKSNKAGLNPDEKGELDRISREFTELGGMAKLRELRNSGESE